MLTKEVLKSVLAYDPDTGIFNWVSKPARNIMPGAKAGYSHPRGYIQIRINGKLLLAHRLAFIYMNGSCPIKVDHINGNCGDNRWRNLRPATTSQNSMNTKKSISSKSGIKGVGWHGKRKKWVASICANGKRIHIGYYRDLIGAELAVRKARIELHGEYANHG